MCIICKDRYKVKQSYFGFFAHSDYIEYPLLTNLCRFGCIVFCNRRTAYYVDSSFSGYSNVLYNDKLKTNKNNLKNMTFD